MPVVCFAGVAAGFAAIGLETSGLAVVCLAAAGLAALDLAASGLPPLLGFVDFTSVGLVAADFAGAGFPADLSVAPLAAAGLPPAGLAAASFAACELLEVSVVPAAPASSAGTETPIISARAARSAVRRAAGFGSSRVTVFPRRESHLRRHSHDVFD